MSVVIRKLSNTKGESGEGSYTLILPKEWCEQNNLQHGDEVHLLMDRVTEGSILVSLPRKEIRDGNDVLLDFDEYTEDSALSRAILRRYLEGYEIIRILNVPKTGNERLHTRQLIRRLSGKLDGCSPNELEQEFELQISSELKSPLDLLDQLYRKTKFMFRDAIFAFINTDPQLASEIIAMDDEADSLYFSMVRTLKILLQDPVLVQDQQISITDTLDYRMVASNLENLADATEIVANSVLSFKRENAKDAGGSRRLEEKTILKIKNLYQIFQEMLAQAFTCFLENDEKQAVNLARRRTVLFDKLRELRSLAVHETIVNMYEEAIECFVDILELVGE